MKKLNAEEPQLLVGSPMCTAFSTWQRVSNKIRGPMIVANDLKRGKALKVQRQVVPRADQGGQILSTRTSHIRYFMPD